jgi:hypothetical protein
MPASGQIPVAGSTVRTMPMKAAPIPDGFGAWSLRNYERGYLRSVPLTTISIRRLPHREQDELLAPLEDVGISAVAPRMFRGIGLDLMVASPHHTMSRTPAGGGVAECQLEGRVPISWADRHPISTLSTADDTAS